MFGKTFDYLRCDAKKANLIEHKDEYIKSGTKQKAKRNIYNVSDYDQFENDQLNEFEIQLKLKGQTKITDTSQLLRILYASNFEMQLALEKADQYTQFIDNNNNYKIQGKSQKILENGWAYIYGRDKQMRPIICINAHLIQLDEIPEFDFLVALSGLMLIVHQYMFFPGKIENIIIIIETQHITVTGHMLENFGTIVQHVSSLFPNTVEKIYILNHSESIKMLWATKIKPYITISTQMKIVSLNSEIIKQQMMSVINYDELEQRHGGTCQEPTKYWPPTVKQQNNLKISNDMTRQKNYEDLSQASSTKKYKAGKNYKPYHPANYDDYPYMIADNNKTQIQQKNYDIDTKDDSRSLFSQQQQYIEPKIKNPMDEDLESRKELLQKGYWACNIF